MVFRVFCLLSAERLAASNSAATAEPVANSNTASPPPPTTATTTTKHSNAHSPAAEATEEDRLHQEYSALQNPTPRWDRPNPFGNDYEDEFAKIANGNVCTRTMYHLSQLWHRYIGVYLAGFFSKSGSETVLNLDIAAGSKGYLSEEQVKIFYRVLRKVDLLVNDEFGIYDRIKTETDLSKYTVTSLVVWFSFTTPYVRHSLPPLSLSLLLVLRYYFSPPSLFSVRDAATLNLAARAQFSAMLCAHPEVITSFLDSPASRTLYSRDRAIMSAFQNTVLNAFTVAEVNVPECAGAALLVDGNSNVYRVFGHSTSIGAILAVRYTHTGLHCSKLLFRRILSLTLSLSLCVYVCVFVCLFVVIVRVCVCVVYVCVCVCGVCVYLL